MSEEVNPPENVGNNSETTESGKMLGGITGKGFMPGQSGNPSGRPKKNRLTEAMEELLEEKLSDPDGMAQFKAAMWAKLLSNKVVGSMTLDTVLDRTEGKVAQPVRVSGELSVSLSDELRKARERADKIKKE